MNEVLGSAPCMENTATIFLPTHLKKNKTKLYPSIHLQNHHQLCLSGCPLSCSAVGLHFLSHCQKHKGSPLLLRHWPQESKRGSNISFSEAQKGFNRGQHSIECPPMCPLLRKPCTDHQSRLSSLSPPQPATFLSPNLLICCMSIRHLVHKASPVPGMMSWIDG